MYNKLDFNTKDYKSLKIGELKRIADYWLRQYLLKTVERQGGRVKCFITKKFFNQDNIEVAHFVPRMFMFYRYSIINCNLVNKKSNSHDNSIYSKELYGDLSKHEYDYKKALAEHYGEEVLRYLGKDGKKIINKNEYILIIKSLKNNNVFYKYYFTEQMFKKNKYYRKGFFKVLGKYTNIRDNIKVEDKYGQSVIPILSILYSGYKPDISTAIDKIQYLKNKLKETREDINDLNITNYIDSTNVILKTHYGDCSLSLQSLLDGYSPSIKSAIDKHSYFLEKCKSKNKNLDWNKIKLLNKYLIKETKMYVQTYESIFLVPAYSLYKIKNFYYEQSIFKKEYYLNKFQKNNTDYSEIDFNKPVTEKQKIICKKHGAYYQSLRSHTKCKYCCSLCSNLSSYKKEDWVKLSKGKESVLYIIECSNDYEKFLKIGISSNFNKRYKNKKSMPYNYKILKTIKSFNSELIWEKEKQIIEKILKFKYSPKIFFKGSVNEVFSINAYDEIIKLI